MEQRQYPRGDEMNLHARLKLVGTMYGRGWTASRIARELDYGIKAANRDIAAVISRYREFDDVDKHLRDVTARMGEQLAKLNEQEIILWKQLDWAREWVIQIDGFGNPLYDHKDDGEEIVKKPTPLYGPRRPGMVPQLIGQLQSLNKEQSSLLGLLNKNVDISVTLQKTELFQIRIMEVIKEADPETYKKLVRVLKAAESTFERMALPASSVTRNIEEVIEAEYVSN